MTFVFKNKETIELIRIVVLTMALISGLIAIFLMVRA